MHYAQLGMVRGLHKSLEAQGKASVSSTFLDQTLILAGLEKDTWEKRTVGLVQLPHSQS